MKKRMMRCILQVVVNNLVTSCSIHGSSGGSDTTRRVGTRRARLFRLLLSSSALLFPLSVSLSPSLSLCLLFSRQSTPVPIRPPIRQNVIINVQLINPSIHPFHQDLIWFIRRIHPRRLPKMPLHYDGGETCLQMGTRLKKKGKLGRKKGLMKEEEDTLVTGRSDVNVPKRVKPVPFFCLSVCV